MSKPNQIQSKLSILSSVDYTKGIYQNSASNEEVTIMSPKELSILLNKLISDQRLQDVFKMNNETRVKNVKSMASRQKTNILKKSKPQLWTINKQHTKFGDISVPNCLAQKAEEQKLLYRSPKTVTENKFAFRCFGYGKKSKALIRESLNTSREKSIQVGLIRNIIEPQKLLNKDKELDNLILSKKLISPSIPHSSSKPKIENFPHHLPSIKCNSPKKIISRMSSTRILVPKILTLKTPKICHLTKRIFFNPRPKMTSNPIVIINFEVFLQ